MGFVLNGWALLWLASGFTSLLLASVVWLEARGRLQNKALAALLALLGTLYSSRGLAMSMSEPADAFGWYSVSFAIWPTTALAGFLFLGTLPSPIARPFSTRWARWVLATAGLGAVVYWIVTLRERILLGVDGLAFYAPWSASTSRGFVGIILFDLMSIAAALVGLAVAIDLYRRAPAGTAARRRAKAYLVAFGISDVLNVFLFGILAWLWNGGDWANWGAVFYKPAPDGVWETIVWGAMGGGFPLANLAFSMLLAHAILRAQLFDIELKIKWGIRRGTLVSIFVATFFAANAIAQQYLQNFGVVAGGAAVGLLVFAVRPLERAADRLAEHALPGVRDTPEYRAGRAREIYRAAVEGALEDGDVTDKERAMLARLADQLGLGPLDMHSIEREARSAATA